MNKRGGITVTVPNTSSILTNGPPKSPLTSRIKKTTKTLLNTNSKSKAIKEKDSVIIRIPEEMLIHGTMEAYLDNEKATVVSLTSSEAKVRLSNEETVFVPTFCLFNQ